MSTKTVPTVYQSSKTAKNSQKTVKQQKNTIGVPIVTCLHRVRLIHKAAQTPLPCETSITCGWAGLTVCVYMDVRCRVLLHSLRLFYLLMIDTCSSFSLLTTVIKFSIFSDPTRKLFAVPPELRRIRYNSKTTTLLPSAKCTRPLFQGRTGCAGWHMISSHAIASV